MSYQFADFSQKLSSSIQHVAQDLHSLRAGKASPQLLDSVQVEAYGTRMRVHELANVSATDPTMLVITPWDRSVVGAIEKAILIAQLNLSPVVDGGMIRIAVPALTEERRKEMVKMLFQKIEAGKKTLRTIRQDTKKDIEARKGTDGVSEDEIESDLVKLEELFKDALDELDTIAKKKEADLMEV